jgi:hypothetical protein
MFLTATKRGFSLLEVCIYVALLSFFITSTAAVVWQVVSGVRSATAQLRTEQEGIFVIQKIEPLLIAAVAATPVSGTSSAVTIQRYEQGVYAHATVRHNAASSSIELQRNTESAFIPLTTNAATVSSLVFHNLPAEGSLPARLGVAMVINGQIFEVEYILENIYIKN